ncbi:hypothetical protein MIND_01328700 [Mycena indigotica]|uniref:Uncharacterized protein n=1 Tax=Mycena indigotica TaxID=2126181 RepID=A0A8H6S2K6_9AGAR|nr:uncharacterized protein MIND_01328700 [Mycena indigotica]KAF7290155.1 hypothetical protein MIND_01328700 [Mycena indigotica]
MDSRRASFLGEGLLDPATSTLLVCEALAQTPRGQQSEVLSLLPRPLDARCVDVKLEFIVARIGEGATCAGNQETGEEAEQTATSNLTCGSLGLRSSIISACRAGASNRAILLHNKRLQREPAEHAIVLSPSSMVDTRSFLEYEPITFWFGPSFIVLALLPLSSNPWTVWGFRSPTSRYIHLSDFLIYPIRVARR